MRKSEVSRKTNETNINLRLNLDGTGEYTVTSGIGFFDHMLALFAKPAQIDLELS